MKYNFDEIIERRGTNSYKWDLVRGCNLNCVKACS